MVPLEAPPPPLEQRPLSRRRVAGRAAAMGGADSVSSWGRHLLERDTAVIADPIGQLFGVGGWGPQ
eukprot:6100142-Pyramimonas_sp.AAC.1